MPEAVPIPMPTSTERCGGAKVGNAALEDNAEPIKPSDASKEDGGPSQAINVPGSTPTNLQAARKKKKKAKKGTKPSAQAGVVAKGFETPGRSDAKDSDTALSRTSTMTFEKTATPTSASPAIRASGLSRAISELKLNMRGGSATPSEDGCSSEASSEDTSPVRRLSLQRTNTQDISVVRDFAADSSTVSRRMQAIEGGLRHDSPHRKMQASDFEHLKCLGKGAFGTVLLVRQHSTGRLFAQKQLKKASLTVQKSLIEQTKTERAILESVNRHPFVVKLYYAFQDKQKLYLILEYAQGGELFHHLAMERTFTEEVAAFYMAEMVLALDHLHRNLGVIYRDLKPENCLLDSEGHLLLTDFGLSKVALEDPLDPDTAIKCSSFMGTIDYMAPEVIQGKEYDQAVDWWSLGALGYDLLTGSPPFTANNHAKIQQKILQAKFNPPYYMSPDAKDILTRLMRKDPNKRLGGQMPKDLATIKSHRFFRKIDWKALQNRDLMAPIQPIITAPEEAENFDTIFTGAAMSPVVSLTGGEESFGGQRRSRLESFGSVDEHFGGFSYVASKSLLDFEL